jgi:hypothetical protein
MNGTTWPGLFARFRRSAPPVLSGGIQRMLSRPTRERLFPPGVEPFLALKVLVERPISVSNK